MIARRLRRAPVEPLSARVLRYRIARGYSPGDLASAAGVYAGSIRRLESGGAVDKRILAPLSEALGVPLCRLVCGEHTCAQRACVPSSRLDAAPELPRSRPPGFTPRSRCDTMVRGSLDPAKSPRRARRRALCICAVRDLGRCHVRTHQPNANALSRHSAAGSPWITRMLRFTVSPP